MLHQWVLSYYVPGAKGKRLALPNARVMIHQPLGGAQGQATDIELEAKRNSQNERYVNWNYGRKFRTTF